MMFIFPASLGIVVSVAAVAERSPPWQGSCDMAEYGVVELGVQMGNGLVCGGGKAIFGIRRTKEK
jgi:hypothetical protein